MAEGREASFEELAFFAGRSLSAPLALPLSLWCARSQGEIIKLRPTTLAYSFGPPCKRAAPPLPPPPRMINDHRRAGETKLLIGQLFSSIVSPPGPHSAHSAGQSLAALLSARNKNPTSGPASRRKLAHSTLLSLRNNRPPPNAQRCGTGSEL